MQHYFKDNINFPIFLRLKNFKVSRSIFCNVQSRDNFLLKNIVSRYFPNIQPPKHFENNNCYEWLKSELDKGKNFFVSKRDYTDFLSKIFAPSHEGAIVHKKEEFFEEPFQNLNDLSGLALLNALKSWEIDQEISEICHRCKGLELLEFNSFEKLVNLINLKILVLMMFRFLNYRLKLVNLLILKAYQCDGAGNLYQQIFLRN